MLDDDLRIAMARVARSMYTLRNKQNIAHKGVVDPDVGDLRYLLAGAQWVMSEFVRRACNLSMQEATRLVDTVQTPIGAAFEDFGTHKLVLGGDHDSRRTAGPTPFKSSGAGACRRPLEINRETVPRERAQGSPTNVERQARGRRHKSGLPSNTERGQRCRWRNFRRCSGKRRIQR